MSRHIAFHTATPIEPGWIAILPDSQRRVTTSSFDERTLRFLRFAGTPAVIGHVQIRTPSENAASRVMSLIRSALHHGLITHLKEAPLVARASIPALCAIAGNWHALTDAETLWFPHRTIPGRVGHSAYTTLSDSVLTAVHSLAAAECAAAREDHMLTAALRNRGCCLQDVRGWLFAG